MLWSNENKRRNGRSQQSLAAPLYVLLISDFHSKMLAIIFLGNICSWSWMKITRQCPNIIHKTQNFSYFKCHCKVVMKLLQSMSELSCRTGSCWMQLTNINLTSATMDEASDYFSTFSQSCISSILEWYWLWWGCWEWEMEIFIKFKTKILRYANWVLTSWSL